MKSLLREIVDSSGFFVFTGTLTGHDVSVFKKNPVIPLKHKKRKEVLKMAKNGKQTSKKVAATASKILRDGRYGKAAKSVAGSALAQTKPGKK